MVHNMCPLNFCTVFVGVTVHTHTTGVFTIKLLKRSILHRSNLLILRPEKIAL